MNKETWQDKFREEFGIHFKDSKGELDFAISFIEEVIYEKLIEERRAKLTTSYDIISEIAERIVNDYANLSGRETAHRAEFRLRVMKHLEKLRSIITHTDEIDGRCCRCYYNDGGGGGACECYCHKI